MWQNVVESRYIEKHKPRMVDGGCGEGSGGEAGSMEDGIMRAVDRARWSMEEELYRKFDEDGGKKMMQVFNMARDRTEDGRDVKRGAVIKNNNGRLITENKEGLRILAANFKELLNGKVAASYLELSSSVRRGGSGGYWTGRSGNSNAQYEKGKAPGTDEVRLEMLEMAGEVGVSGHECY